MNHIIRLIDDYYEKIAELIERDNSESSVLTIDLDGVSDSPGNQMKSRWFNDMSEDIKNITHTTFAYVIEKIDKSDRGIFFSYILNYIWDKYNDPRYTISKERAEEYSKLLFEKMNNGDPFELRISPKLLSIVDNASRAKLMLNNAIDHLVKEFVFKNTEDETKPKEDEILNLPDTSGLFDYHTEKIAWLYELGILNQIVEIAKDKGELNISRAATIVSTIAPEIKFETIKAVLRAIYRPCKGNEKNNPLNKEKTQIRIQRIREDLKIDKKK